MTVGPELLLIGAAQHFAIAFEGVAFWVWPVI